MRKGPFKYYVSKIVGGWVWPNAYVCLHSGWVGKIRFLRNQKITEKQITRKFQRSENLKSYFSLLQFFKKRANFFPTSKNG